MGFIIYCNLHCSQASFKLLSIWMDGSEWYFKKCNLSNFFPLDSQQNSAFQWDSWKTHKKWSGTLDTLFLWVYTGGAWWASIASDRGALTFQIPPNSYGSINKVCFKTRDPELKVHFVGTNWLDFTGQLKENVDTLISTHWCPHDIRGKLGNIHSRWGAHLEIMGSLQNLRS